VPVGQQSCVLAALASESDKTAFDIFIYVLFTRVQPTVPLRVAGTIIVGSSVCTCKEEAFMPEFATDKGFVSQQYNKWIYPQPIMDLSAPELRNIRDGGDPAVNFYTYWPNQNYRNDLHILIAGCGTNAAARYAFYHPNATVVGIDFSSASLEHERYLKEKHGLNNLTLRQGYLEEVHTLGQDFDFIEVSGVLHHLPDPLLGLKALGRVLRPDGTIAIMVYGQYGRTGVYMLQEMFRLMALGQSEDDLAIVKKTLAAIPKRHIIHDYLGRAGDVKYDAGLVDTFLHRQDRAYTVAGCLDLVRQAGMSFMNWWDNILYYPEGQLASNDYLYQKVATLSDEKIWNFMELYNGTLGQHCFCVCHPERSRRDYKIDFNSEALMNYIPVRRSQEVSSEGRDPAGCVTLKRDQWPRYTLDAATSALYREIDGTRTIRDCFERAKLTPEQRLRPEIVCRAAFRYLWRLSYIFLRIP
jgi:SAM-dependent methyltransferase